MAATSDDAVRASVIVVTWNGRHLLEDCLASLAAQDAPGIDLEVVVVDNGSTDDTLPWLAATHPEATVVPLPENLGFAGGANAGIRVARGEVALLINNDAAAEAGFVAAAVGAVLADDNVAAVTGLIVLAGRYTPVADGPHDLVGVDGIRWALDTEGVELTNSTGNIVTRAANGLDRDWLVPTSALERSSGEVAGFSGGAVALRVSAAREVGLFDERLFMYYEDTDLAWRLRAAGWAIRFERSAVVRHRHAASSGARSDFFLFHNERNRLLFALRNAPGSVILRATARTVIGAVLAGLRGDPATLRRRARAVAGALRLAPAYLADRRRDSRSAVVPRRRIARDYLVP